MCSPIVCAWHGRQPQGRLGASLALLAGSLLLPLQALAAPALLLIQDGSGSMWGRVDGTPKIVAAKTVLTDLLAETPGEVETGLMVYGHRRKGDCADIELVAPLGSPPAAMVSAVKAVMPKGKTPISSALEQTGALVEAREDATTIALVSDGIETCDGDPCAVAKALRERGLNLVIHVVGFDVDPTATAQLSCIAEAGGGRYFGVADAAALTEALGTVRDSVARSEPIPPPPPAIEAAPTESSSKRIRIAGPGRVVLRPAAWVETPPYRWALEDAESGERRLESTALDTRVKGGEYRVVWRQTEHRHSPVPIDAVVSVKPGTTAEVPLDTGLRLTVPTGVAPPYFWALREIGAEEPIAVFRETLAPQLVPAGRFALLWRQGEHTAATVDLGTVDIEPGRLNDLGLDAGLVLQPADWLADHAPEGYGLQGASGETVAWWSEFGPQLAPPGRYRLHYRPSEHRHSDIPWGEVTIGTGGLTPVPINSGVRFITADDMRPPYRVYFVNPETEAEVWMQETWEPLPLPPGTYRMDWWETQHGSRRETLVEALEIEAGSLLEIEL